jgi:hypothetical protein
MEVNSRLCHMEGFCVSSVEPLGSIAKKLVYRSTVLHVMFKLLYIKFLKTAHFTRNGDLHKDEDGCLLGCSTV